MRHRTTKFRSGIVALALATLANSAGAQIFANGTPNLSTPSGTPIGGFSIPFRAADDFNFTSAASISSIRFWMMAVDQRFQGTISYAFYQDAAGALGPVISSGSASNLTPQFLSNLPNTYNIYLVDVNLPAALNLTAGTYWLELHDGATLATNTAGTLLWWASSDPNVGNARDNQTGGVPSAPNVYADALAFSLYGNVDPPSSSVPEPSTMALSFAGFAALGFLRLRSRRALRRS